MNVILGEEEERILVANLTMITLHAREAIKTETLC